jgi:3'-phosphoadenosine 5'-phosphosulfate sulfotransferase (PAPS reductase)/FAD synthetase
MRQSWKTCVSKLQSLIAWSRGHRALPAPTGEHETTSHSTTDSTESPSAPSEEEQEETREVATAHLEDRSVDVFFYTGQASQTLTLQLATSLDNDDHEYSSETDSDDSFGSIIVGGIFAAPDTFNWADDVEEAFQAARPVTALGVYEPVDYE